MSLFILFAVSQLKQSTKEGYFNIQGNLEGKHILFYLKLIFIEMCLLYTVVLVSTGQQTESVNTDMYIPSVLDFIPIHVTVG